MALVLKTIYKGYGWLFTDLSDPRLPELDLFLMSSPIKPVLIITFYLYFIYNLGPKLMENRKPFNLKYVMMVYNIVQIVLNAYVVYEGLYEVLFYMNWSCEPLDFSSDPRPVHVLKVYHVFFLLKALDLLDTVFFVLRKKYNQISFLHVYHHFGMFLMLWASVKFFGGGSGTFVGVINGTVHIIMYSYYLLTVIDDKWKDSIQFMLFIFIYGRLLFKSDCDYPKICCFFFVPQNCFMLVLFGDFYRKTYLSNKKATKEPKEISTNGKNAAIQ